MAEPVTELSAEAEVPTQENCGGSDLANLDKRITRDLEKAFENAGVDKVPVANSTPPVLGTVQPPSEWLPRLQGHTSTAEPKDWFQQSTCHAWKVGPRTLFIIVQQ